MITETEVKTVMDNLNNLLSTISADSLNITDISENIKSSWNNDKGKKLANNIKTSINDIEAELNKIKDSADALKQCKVSYNLVKSNEIINTRLNESRK